MRPNPLAPWELRIGVLRVYYDIEEQPEQVVTILAIGIKKRNRVLIVARRSIYEGRRKRAGYRNTGRVYGGGIERPCDRH
jgi:hypothetical protein